MAPPLLLVIPTHGRPTLLGRTLRSIAECTLPEGYQGCVVVENGAPSGVEAVVAQAAAEAPEAGFRYAYQARANRSNALNAGIATASGETLALFLDDDVRLHPQALVAYTEAAAGGQGQAYYGGTLKIDYDVVPPAWMIDHFPFSARGMDVAASDWPGWFMGANWAAFVRDIQAVGGYDPSFGLGSPAGGGGDETDLQRRLQERGLTPTPVPSAVVWHYVPAERSSPEWIVQRRRQQGAQTGHSIARGLAENSIPREIGTALRSLLLLPAFLLLRNEQRVVAHKMKVSRAVGLVQGYIVSRRELARGA